MEDFKREMATIEKQIAAKNQELRVMKQYKRSIENALRIKQKVDGRHKPIPEAPEKIGAEPGC